MRVVQPQLKLTGGFQLPTGAGAGKLVTSDATGVGSWKTVPGATPNVLMPILAQGSPYPATTKLIGTAFKAWFMRAIVPVSGKLKEVSVFNGATVAGNTRVAIFDTGDAVAGKYTLLKQSASTPMSGASVWQTMGALEEPTLTAEQHVLLAIMTDSTTAIFGYSAALANLPFNAAAAQLPTNYMAVPGGAAPKAGGTKTYGSLAYATITEAELEVPGVVLPYTIIGRIE